jgi:hypothetical protein
MSEEKSFQSLEEFEQNGSLKSSSLVLLGWVMDGYQRSVELLLYFKIYGEYSSGGKRYIWSHAWGAWNSTVLSIVTGV